MKKSRITKLLSFLLVLLMVLEMVPLSTVHAADNTDLSIDFNYKSEFANANAALIHEANQGHKYTQITSDKVFQDGYSWVKIFDGDLKREGGRFREVMESTKPNEKYITLSQDVDLNFGDGKWVPIKITSDKVLDLNGFTLTWYDKTNKENGENWQSTNIYDHYLEKYFIYIQEGATLTIIDSSAPVNGYDTGVGTGKIVTTGQIISAFEQQLDYYTHRDMFVVDGNLVIYGGTFQAGRQKDQYKSKFSWSKLADCLGKTLDLGLSIAEYATGLDAANAAMKDVKESLKTPPAQGNTSDSTDSDSAGARPDGSNGTQNQTVNTPASQGAADNSKDRAQTVGERTGTDTTNNNTTNNQTGGSTAQTNGQNEANSQGTAKKDKNSQIAAAEKTVVQAAMDKDKITDMFTKGAEVVSSISGMIGNVEGTRVTQTIFGTVAKVNTSGTLVVYGGTLQGHGSTPNLRNAAVEIVRLGLHAGSDVKQKNDGGRAYIYGGTIEGYSGANVFNFVRAPKAAQTGIARAFQCETDNHEIKSITYLTEGATVTEPKTSKSVYVEYPYTYELDAAETNNLEVLHYENQDAVAADKTGKVDPIPVDTSNVVVRGGTFRTFSELANQGARLPYQREIDPTGEGMTFVKYTGTSGSVNLGLESFGEDMIRDGRIQLVDVYGDGTLVLMDEQVDEAHLNGLKHYRLFCGDTELRHIRYLNVYPMNAGANATHSFSLQTYYGQTNLSNISTWNEENNEENDHTAPFAGDEYFFDYEFDARDARDYYLMPNLDGGIYDTSMQDSEAWYYPEPVDSKGELIPDFASTITLANFTYKGTSYTAPVQYMKDLYIFQDGDYDDFSTATYYRSTNDSYRENLKWFRYRVYRVDPITRENISESDTWGVDQPLAEVVYGVAQDDVMRCKLDLYDLSQYLIEKTKGTKNPWTGYKQGELYRIVLNVDEYLNYGYTGEDNIGCDRSLSMKYDSGVGNDWSVKSTYTRKREAFAGNLPVATTESSVLFRCSSVSEQAKLPSTDASSNVFYDTDYTPLQFDSYAILAGEDATINFVNAKVSQADNAGNDFISVYYQWYVSDDAIVDRDPSDANRVTDKLIAGMTNINMDWNTSSDHKPEKWNPAADKYDYRNTLSPDDPHYEEYGEDGLHDNPEYWTMYDLHAYTTELRQNELCMKPGTTGNLTMQNNNPFAFNTDSCYIPKELAGKYVYVKAIVTNLKEEYTYIYDRKQVYYSHPMLIIDASMLTPKNQQPAMELSHVSGDCYYSEMQGYKLGTNAYYSFTGTTLPEAMKKAGFEVRLSQRIETQFNPYTTLYTEKNGNTVNLKNYITKEGLHYVYQTQELIYKRPYWSATNGFKEALYKEELVATRMDIFRVYASTTGADGYINSLSAVGVGTPIIGKKPSTINTVKTDNPGAYVYDVEWQIYDPNSYSGWILMKDDAVFEEGQRYMVTLTFKPESGYFFDADASGMSAYINGEEATVVANPYASNKAYVDMEFTPVSNPAFTQQPQSGNSILNDGLNVNWELNFTPTQLKLVRINSGSGRPFYAYTDLDPAATSANVTPGGDVYEIRAYINDSNYYSSQRFTVTRKAPYTATSTFTVGGKVTVDTERIAQYSDFWMEAYLNGEITYQWYRGDSAISGATGASYTPTSADVGKKIYAKVSKDSTTLDTPEMTVTATAGLDVSYIGKAAATVNGNSVTVSNANACKLGYLGMDGKYVTFKATKNADGTYTYTVPDGVSKVILGVKGDVTGDNRINVADVSKAYAHAKGSTALTGDNLFIADITGDNRINVADVSKAYAHAKGSSPLTWDT